MEKHSAELHSIINAVKEKGRNIKEFVRDGEKQIIIKGESYEKNNYVGRCFNDAADIYWRMLGAVGGRW